MLSAEDRLANLTGTIGNPEEVKYIRELIACHEWRFAKTYAAFCPHEYTLRNTWGNKVDYNALVLHIWKYGVDGYYGNKSEPNRYWFDHEGGYYYFIYPEDVDSEGRVTKEAYLVNRAKVTDFLFWTEDDLIGTKVRCKYKFTHKKEEQT